MSRRSKYNMTNAAAKRIAAALYEKGMENHYLQVGDIHAVLQQEDFYSVGEGRYRYIVDLVDYLMEEEGGRMVRWITEAFVRDYYDQRTGINQLESGLQRLGLIPYPEDD